MLTPRPTFLRMWKEFTKIYGDGTIAIVGEMIGGKVQANIELGATEPTQGFTNACAIRMSYCLNYSGVAIPRGEWKTVSGSDGNLYIYRVADLLKFLKYSFGKPDKTIKNPKVTDFDARKGILVFNVNWSDASGHATLWNGSGCSDECYFPLALEASIWELN